MQYKQYATNAPVRPWLMYKVEKVVEDNLKCEHCGFEPYVTYPNENKKRLISLMDVDHSNKSNTHPKVSNLVTISCFVNIATF
jgi:hypothetical protein